tara:strand:- start:50 stop:337 length:288 start_codon:yes stop_codon:yes gene_type:complete
LELKLLKLKKEIKFKINGLIDKPLWKSIPCICDATDIAKQYPLTDCKNCKFQECQDSIPKQKFKSNGKDVNEIKIVRGQRYQDIIGWTWHEADDQ